MRIRSTLLACLLGLTLHTNPAAAAINPSQLGAS